MRVVFGGVWSQGKLSYGGADGPGAPVSLQMVLLSFLHCLWHANTSSQLLMLNRFSCFTSAPVAQLSDWLTRLRRCLYCAVSHRTLSLSHVLIKGRELYIHVKSECSWAAATSEAPCSNARLWAGLTHWSQLARAHNNAAAPKAKFALHMPMNSSLE